MYCLNEQEFVFQGAIPATVGLLGGYLHVGLSDNQLRHLCEPTTQPERKIKVQLQHHFVKCLLYLNDKLPITFQVSRRDFPFALASRLDGGTTVSGTLVAAASVVSAATDGRADCALPIFVTGGIGGVHRGGEATMDVSADLVEMGR